MHKINSVYSAMSGHQIDVDFAFDT